MMITISNRLNLPQASANYNGLTIDALIYISPLSHLFEFVLGMCTALAFLRMRKNYLDYWSYSNRSKIYFTLVEIVITFSVVLAMYFPVSHIGAYFTDKIIGGAAAVWIHKSSVAPFAAALILLLALQRGYVAKLLASRLFVRLGEISYAIYLLHGLELRCVQGLMKKHYLASIPIHWLYFAYLLLVFASSYAMWLLIEKPMRRRILQWYNSKQTRVVVAVS